MSTRSYRSSVKDRSDISTLYCANSDDNNERHTDDLQGGKIERIMMMTRVIIVAIYLCGADVVTQPRPRSPSRSQIKFPTPQTRAQSSTLLSLAHTDTVYSSFAGSLPQHDIRQGN